MNKYWLMFGVGLMFWGAGCNTVPTQIEKKPREELKNPWSEQDRFTQTPDSEIKATEKLPLPAIAPRKKVTDGVSDKLRREFVKSSAQAHNNYLDAKRKKSGVDDAVISALVIMAEKRINTPLSEKYIRAGLEAVAASGKRTHDFVVPSYAHEHKARAAGGKDEASRIILLYIERYKLYTDICSWLNECGMQRSDIHWIPLFTYLELELIGIEKDYKVHTGK